MKPRIALAALSAVAALALVCHHHHDERSLRFATFNIEDFPKDDLQVAGAFSELAALHASFVAVQEIGDPALFASAARDRLGASWRFVSEPRTEHEPDHLLGVAYDSSAWSLRSWRTYDDTRIDGRNKAVFEARLRPIDGGATVRVLVVHLRSGSEGRATRELQYAALAHLLDRLDTRDRVVMLGDFNATEESDRESLRALARHAHLAWATEPLACSAFWRRADGCPRSRLDHVLTWTAPAGIEAAGACAREGCDAQPTCPLDATQISDHCPVVVGF